MESITLQQVLPDAFAGNPEPPKSDLWLHDVTFRKGEYYLVEAASGTGKSSLCSFLYGARTDYAGRILFDAAEQQVKSGGSGPGCCAAVLCGHILPRLLRRSQKRVLFVATGALMSQTTFLQKESIPAVAHLVELRAPEKESGA